MSEWTRFFDNTNKKRSIFQFCNANRGLIKLIQKFAPEGEKILEIGCGTGVLSLILSDLGYDVTASDIDNEVIEYAKKKYGRLDNKNLAFQCLDTMQIGKIYPNGHFNTVCHKGVMEHFTDSEIISGLSEQRRIAKQVIFSVPNNNVKLTKKHFGNERLLSEKHWKTLIRNAGFSNVTVYGENDFYDKKFLYMILPSLMFRDRFSFWWKYFSKHFVFRCE